jgi:hypothetical protein
VFLFLDKLTLRLILPSHPARSVAVKVAAFNPKRLTVGGLQGERMLLPVRAVGVFYDLRVNGFVLDEDRPAVTTCEYGSLKQDKVSDDSVTGAVDGVLSAHETRSILPFCITTRAYHFLSYADGPTPVSIPVG